MKFRVARHTNDLEKIKTFYTTVLGFDVLGRFENHDSYDGLFLGKPNLDWHLEFTKSNEIVAFNYTEDDILVFYPITILEYNHLIERVLNNSIEIITSKNSYWNKNGKMILDPDGYRIIISNLKAV
ncbi:VOC family protein [uncultured Flavobacterium sp.]|mgnify:CR=1 FL=1|uniref:VOC family protein n=1 Tax=uncultured Flavobacterium sp. TaxID=165435 RepID=UPI0030ED3137